MQPGTKSLTIARDMVSDRAFISPGEVTISRGDVRHSVKAESSRQASVFPLIYPAYPSGVSTRHHPSAVVAVTLRGVPMRACEDISAPCRGSVRMWAVEMAGRAHCAPTVFSWGEPFGLQDNTNSPMIKLRIDFITSAKIAKKAEPSGLPTYKLWNNVAGKGSVKFGEIG